MHYLFLCPLKGQFSWNLTWLQATLCRNNGLCPSGVKGCKWMTFPYPLVMIPLRHCGGYEFLSFKMKSLICKVQWHHWILPPFLWPSVLKQKGLFYLHHKDDFLKLAFLSFGEMCTLETQVCEPENCSSLLSTHYVQGTISSIDFSFQSISLLCGKQSCQFKHIYLIPQQINRKQTKPLNH